VLAAGYFRATVAGRRTSGALEVQMMMTIISRHFSCRYKHLEDFQNSSHKTVEKLSI